MRSAWCSNTLVALLIVAKSCVALPIDYYENGGDEGAMMESNDVGGVEQSEKQPEQIEIFKTDRPLGHVSGLAITPKGDIVAFHRAERVWDENSFNADETFNKKVGGAIKNSTLALIDPSTGKIREEFGANQFYMPHGLSIDTNGDLWVTDVGSHQVHKIDGTSRKIVKSFGEAMVPGDDEKHFCKPTDVAIAKNGNFFVADGYCNSRVLKFDANGKLLDVIYAAVEDGIPSEFVVPHSLTLIEDMNIICVADRENERVQCFSAGLEEGGRKVPAGIPITSANDIGRVYAIREKNHYLMGVTGSSEDLEAQLFTIDVQTGKTNTFAKGIENAHALAISADGSVYVSQIEPSRIVKISLM